jgi:hypothetical protein
MPPMPYLLEWRMALAKDMLLRWLRLQENWASVRECVQYGIHALDWPLTQRICALNGLSTIIIVRQNN